MKNNVFIKHHKTFSKKCILENDFFVCTKHLKRFPTIFKVATKHRKMSQSSRNFFLSKMSCFRNSVLH
jgi:hypothetical protein